MANNDIKEKWLIVYQGTKDNLESDANKTNYNNKLVIVTGGTDTNAEPYLYVNNGTASIEIPIPKMYLKGIKIGTNGEEQGFIDDFLAFAESNGISITFKGNAVTIGIDDATLAKINSIDNKISKTDTIPAENIGGLSDGANGLASTNPIIANRVPYLKADAFAFLQPEDFTVEVAYDGITWETLDNNNADVLGMFSQWNFGTGFPIDGTNIDVNSKWKVNSKIRITLSPNSPRNSKVDFVALNVYANGRVFDILTEYCDISSGKEVWYSVGGPLSITSNGIAFVKYNQYFSFAGYKRGGARFTFTIKTNTVWGSKIVGISGFGSQTTEISPTSSNAPYTLGTLWNWDYLKNVYFPNDIYEGGTPLKNKYASIASAIQSIESADDAYITISTKAGTAVPTKVIAAKTAKIAENKNGLATAEDVRASKLPNPEYLEISLNGTTSAYNGSSKCVLMFYAPKNAGSKGQVFKSIDGITVDWDNVDWSEIKNKPDTINFAKDLTGVLEATPEEFTYRPSARDTSIRDGGAIIRRIKGNTTVWEQMGRCPEEKNWMFEPYGNNAIRQWRQSAEVEWSGWGDNIYLQYPQGDKILVEIIPLNSNYLRDVNYLVAFGSAVYINEPKIVTASGEGISMRCSPESIGFIFIPQIHNLTRMFGAGNEPTTVEEFKAIYPDIYPYCEPTIRNVKTTAIETIGFNQWDEQWEVGRFNTVTGENRESSNHIRCKNLIKVLPNTVYALYVGDSRSGIYAMFYDNNGNILTPIVHDEDSWIVDNLLRISSNIRYNSFITPEGASWMKFYLHADYGSTYTNDVCISLFHTGIRRGEYEPYKEHILNLPEIAKYFTNGMNGVGDVYDEINSENAVKRIGKVDLGTLTWEKYSYSSTNTVYVARDLHGATGKRTGKTAKYSNTTTAIADMPDKTLLTRTDYPTYIYICDNDYSSVDEFKAAISGVYLYYELAEPIVTPILEPVQLVYDVEDFGTERAIAQEDSAPFRADIVYQFNAEGRIRDNGRNIERLENNIRSYHDDGVMVTIDREIITTKSIIGNSEFKYALPDAPQGVKGDADGTLATEFWVQKNMPTEVAIATQKMRPGNSLGLDLLSNIVYEFATIQFLTIKSFVSLQGNYDDIWIIRFACAQNFKLQITQDTVRWKDGIEPAFATSDICELTFKCLEINTQRYIIGEWKIYR